MLCHCQRCTISIHRISIEFLLLKLFKFIFFYYQLVQLYIFEYITFAFAYQKVLIFDIQSRCLVPTFDVCFIIILASIKKLI